MKIDRIKLRKYICQKEFDKRECERFIKHHILIIEDYCCGPTPTLPEDFMREHKDDVNWWMISRNKPLSE